MAYKTEYKIARGRDLNELEIEVNRLLKLGWELNGSVKAFSHYFPTGDKHCLYMQAMTHKELQAEIYPRESSTDAREGA